MANNSEDPTLHLPRIMALHGGGTNATIFRMQCRMLERALSPNFRLVFAEAPFPAQPGPDVTQVYKDYGPFKAWLRIRPEDPIQAPGNVVHQVNNSLTQAQLEDDQRGATGELVGNRRCGGRRMVTTTVSSGQIIALRSYLLGEGHWYGSIRIGPCLEG